MISVEGPATILVIPVSFFPAAWITWRSQYPNLELGRCPSPSVVCNRDIVDENHSQLECQSSPPPPTIVEPRSSPASASAEFVTTSGTNFMLGESKYTVVGWGSFLNLNLGYVVLLTNLLQWKRLLGGIDWYHFCGYERCFCWYRENWGNDRPHMVLYSIISTLNSGADLIFLETNVYYDCRGFNEITSASSNGATNYYQIWSGSTPTINTGLTGLQNFGLFIVI